MPIDSMPLDAVSRDAGPFHVAHTSPKAARRTIRRCWSSQEKLRRREMAELMQQRLLQTLGGRFAS